MTADFRAIRAGAAAKRTKNAVPALSPLRYLPRRRYRMTLHRNAHYAYHYRRRSGA